MSDSEHLAKIAEEYTTRLRAGETPSIDSYAEEHPDQADQIRKLLSSIRAMEQLSHREETERKFERTTRRLAIAPDGLLGDFKIIRELGRGGMGVVYEAESQSLEIRVALKILGPTMAGSAKQLARFQREAKAVAKLHHTNIVKVYGVGEHEGLYYYAMQLIDGITLAEAIDVADHTGTFVTQNVAASSTATEPPTTTVNVDTKNDSDSTVDHPPVRPISKTGSISDSTQSSRWTRIAALGECVADALQHAHTNGVWHRDIKPSNLILDQGGNIWITDFGLARYEDREDVTATGDIVGTPRYMAPEQFEGQFDGRCDTYGLGMTIYEMLTLQPAFKTMGPQLIKQKTTSHPPLPRSINPAIPQDLETIVLKACEVDPAKRYKTPGDLGEDLRRFLEDRPILARRITARERLYRWAKRNPLSAALAILSTISLAGLLTVFVVWNVQMRGKVRELDLEQEFSLRKEREARASAGRSRELAETYQEKDRLQMAQTQNLMFPEPVELELNKAEHVSMSGLGQSDRAYLATELRFALELAEKYKAIVELEVGAAYSLTKAGRIHQMVGEYNKAAACYIDAHERFTNLEAARRARRLTVVYDPRRLQPMGIDFLAELVSINKRLDEVRPFVTNAISIPETLGSATALKLLDEDPGNILETSSRCKLAYVDVLHSRHINMLKRQGWEQLIGQPIKNRGKFQQEFEENETAINIVQLLLTKDRTNHDYRIMGIRIQTDRARLELLRGKETEATIYLGNAARALGEWLIAQEAEEMRSALRAELAYVLCLAPKPIENVDVTADEVRTSLSSFSKRMKALIATDKRATRAKELARIADQRLAQYIEMQGRAN